jgi:hypothetical protein
VAESAFGVEHGEVSKALGVGPKIPKPKMPGLKTNLGARGLGSSAMQRGQAMGQKAGMSIRNNLKPIAAAGGTGLAGFGLGNRNKNKPPTQPRSL